MLRESVASIETEAGCLSLTAGLSETNTQLKEDIRQEEGPLEES